MAPTWLMFFYLGIASFAPVAASVRAGWWMPYYYGALLMWWVLVSIAVVRRHVRNGKIIETAKPYTAAIRRRSPRTGSSSLPVMTSISTTVSAEVNREPRASASSRTAEAPLRLSRGWAEVKLPKS
jgi:hypothetical protein